MSEKSMVVCDNCGHIFVKGKDNYKTNGDKHYCYCCEPWAIKKALVELAVSLLAAMSRNIPNHTTYSTDAQRSYIKTHVLNNKNEYQKVAQTPLDQWAIEFFYRLDLDEGA